jgi:hypothetical protein
MGWMTSEQQKRYDARVAARIAAEAKEATFVDALKEYKSLLNGTTEDIDEAIEMVMVKFPDLDGLVERLDEESN